MYSVDNVNLLTALRLVSRLPAFTMHRCLLIDEILERIVWKLPREDDCFPYSANYQTPWAFALTCRAFLDPGLDVLWTRLDSTRPLAFAFRSTIELIFVYDGPDAEFDDSQDDMGFDEKVTVLS